MNLKEQKNKWIKVNADRAFFFSQQQKGASGVVMNNALGNFVAAANHFYPRVDIDTMTAEVLACKRAAKLAMEMGADKVIIGIYR